MFDLKVRRQGALMQKLPNATSSPQQRLAIGSNKAGKGPCGFDQSQDPPVHHKRHVRISAVSVTGVVFLGYC
jgi:hypothetical protein